MAESKPLRVAVVGGGIAGLSLAVGIIQEINKGANLELTVYEQASKFAEIGAGVSLGPNSQRALFALGLEEQVRKLGSSPKETHDLWFEWRFAETSHPRCGELITTITGDGAGNGHVHRADFLDRLLDLVPSKYCSNGKRVVDYESYSDRAILKFADGTTAETDLIVACDGVKSLLRKSLYTKKGEDMSKQQEKYAEWIAWRGLIPADKYTEAIGTPPVFSTMWLGLDRHILTFPVKGGQMANLVGFVRDPEHKKIHGQTGPWQENRPIEEMLEDYKGFNDKCVNLMKAIPNPSIWGIFDLPALPFSVGERIVLAGDAAHGTTPHQGAGAGQATEDALFLARLLGSPNVSKSQSPEKLQKALELYQRYRHERAAQVQITSAQAGLLYEGRGVKGEGQDFDKVKANLDDRMKWIWDYDINGNVKRMLEEAEKL
ncbi:FAD/NAD(P)-binding domain-containing protein [Cystobasidium minutum MCA 4210]|uniref:FAD/NAD(P)-binding domain-containing protein n=1 Tax=Cystobasidium minutum MCA 4210 TaxID=1397322 RepID=UPI0034CFD30C|eukprot:jgi/Rhomi1/169205/fgenesh1_kg.3_\